MRGATGHTQPKRVVLDTNLHLTLFPCKKTPKNSIVSTDINDQRILQSGWVRSTPGHTQPKVVLLDAILP